MKKILITGPLGQDGRILTELLHNEYELYGVCRLTTPIDETLTQNKIKLCVSDLTDITYVDKLINDINPDIIINFAGETDVINPWADIDKTFEQNFKIPTNILNSIIKNNRDIFFFQSSSSLMYGRSNEKIITESSNFSPMFPYGVSKLSTHNLISEYRHKYNINCSSGIFFNHESYHRSNKFISKKLSSLVSQIMKGEIKKINMFDLNFNRDISHAEDFMKGVKQIIKYEINEDFIFSSGISTNVFEFSKKFFTLHNLDFYDYINYTDSGNYPNDYSIIGDNTKLKSIGWLPSFSVDDIITDMVYKEINL
jgi:GDPmannose 4,6-dehydratase